MVVGLITISWSGRGEPWRQQVVVIGPQSLACGAEPVLVVGLITTVGADAASPGADVRAFRGHVVEDVVPGRGLRDGCRGGGGEPGC